MKKIQLPKMIDHFRKEKGWTMKELGQKMCKAESTVSLWISGKRSPMVDDFDKLVTLFETDSDTLMYGASGFSSTLSEINKISSQLEEPRQEIVLETATSLLYEQNKVIEVAFFDYDYYDCPLFAGTGEYLTDGVKETVSLPIDVNADFVAPVSGDSMEPEYHEGDYIFVKLTFDLTDGDIGVFELDNDAYIKQLKIEDNTVFLHSLNSKYKDKEVLPDSDFRTVGKVVASYTDK